MKFIQSNLILNSIATITHVVGRKVRTADGLASSLLHVSTLARIQFLAIPKTSKATIGRYTLSWSLLQSNQQPYTRILDQIRVITLLKGAEKVWRFYGQ